MCKNGPSLISYVTRLNRFRFRLLLFLRVSILQEKLRALATLHNCIRAVVVLHDGSKTEDETGEREAQQERHKSWKCSEIARMPYVIVL